MPAMEMRELSDDEIIHVPLKYLAAFGTLVPSYVPPLTASTAITVLRDLVKRGAVCRLK